DKNRWFFYENGIYDKEEFLIDWTGNCEQDTESLNMVKGTWERLEGNNFAIKVSFSNGMETERPEITFPNKNTMILTYEGNEETPEVDNYYHEFNRIDHDGSDKSK